MKKHSSDPPSSSSGRFPISIKSLSRQALTDGCPQVVEGARIIYRYLKAAKHYYAAQRAAIMESLQKLSEDATIRTKTTTPDTSGTTHQSAEQKRAWK